MANGCRLAGMRTSMTTLNLRLEMWKRQTRVTTSVRQTRCLDLTASSCRLMSNVSSHITVIFIIITRYLAMATASEVLFEVACVCYDLTIFEMMLTTVAVLHQKVYLSTDNLMQMYKQCCAGSDCSPPRQRSAKTQVHQDKGPPGQRSARTEFFNWHQFPISHNFCNTCHSL